MKNLFVVVTLFLGVLIESPRADREDHPPTVAQCQADLNLWRSQITEYMKAETARRDTGTPDKSALMRLTMRQLNDRASEMGNCAIIDSSKEDEYNNEVGGYMKAEDDRYVFFVQRHRLEKQLFQEDLAGQR